MNKSSLNTQVAEFKRRLESNLGVEVTIVFEQDKEFIKERLRRAWRLKKETDEQRRRGL